MPAIRHTGIRDAVAALESFQSLASFSFFSFLRCDIGSPVLLSIQEQSLFQWFLPWQDNDGSRAEGASWILAGRPVTRTSLRSG